MVKCEICSVDDGQGRLAAATDVTRVACNVCAFQNEIFTFWRCPNCQSLHCREEVDLDCY
jgi:hypothetical protein